MLISFVIALITGLIGLKDDERKGLAGFGVFSSIFALLLYTAVRLCGAAG